MMSWDEVFEVLAPIDVPGKKIYGVPRGGMIAAGFLTYARPVTCPDKADLILDDIIDTGRTRARYRAAYPDKPFVALIDKLGSHKNLGWVIFPWETTEIESADDIIIRQLQFIGEDPAREGLRETPVRVLRAWKEQYAGYAQDPSQILKSFKDGACDEMVLLKDIEFYSTCEHHMLPFYGKAHVAYIPNGRVVGVSKLARLLDVYARRLQIQERICQQVTSTLMDQLRPKGAACIIEAQHFCMKSRGVQKQDSVMVTSSLKGVFLERPEARAELMGLIK